MSSSQTSVIAKVEDFTVEHPRGTHSLVWVGAAAVTFVVCYLFVGHLLGARDDGGEPHTCPPDMHEPQHVHGDGCLTSECIEQRLDHFEMEQIQRIDHFEEKLQEAKGLIGEKVH